MSFEEAVLATKDPFSEDFEDALHPANLITWQLRHLGVSCTSSPPRATIGSASSALAGPRDMNYDSMKKLSEPSDASLQEMPEIQEPRFHRRPGRGQHANRSTGEIVAIDPELWLHFGSAEPVNDALRRVLAERKGWLAPELQAQRKDLFS